VGAGGTAGAARTWRWRLESQLLLDYLGVSERQLVKTVERLTVDGKYELAASLLESSGDRFEHSASVSNAKRLVYLKLMEKRQNADPFKFIIYSAKIGESRRWLRPTEQWGWAWTSQTGNRVEDRFRVYHTGLRASREHEKPLACDSWPRRFPG
jgi:hypothetical protein